MPYSNNDGIKIYYEIEGSGPDLILAHGFSSTGEDWRELGYVEQLCQHYRLILVDARGHGKCDKPHDPKAYAPEFRVKDYLTVLNDLGVSKAHYWGEKASHSEANAGMHGFIFGRAICLSPKV